MASALRRDGNAQLLEGDDIATQRPSIHLQAPGQLATAELAVALQQFEQGEHAHRGLGHFSIRRKNQDRI